MLEYYTDLLTIILLISVLFKKCLYICIIINLKNYKKMYLETKTIKLELEIEVLTNILNSGILSENERIVIKNLLEEIKTECKLELMQD